MLNPCFFEHPIYIESNSGITFVARSRQDFLLDIGTLKWIISLPIKAGIISSPNNPTGVVYPVDQLK